MTDRDPEKNFEALWNTFHERYPFFALRNVDWQKQYDTYRPQVTSETSSSELFEIFCQMLDPLDDGHVEVTAREIGQSNRRKWFFSPEPMTRFRKEFSAKGVKQLFKTTAKTLAADGFGAPKETEAWILHYCRSKDFGYLRILELEDVSKRKLTRSLDRIGRDFAELKGFIIDIRDLPGGEDSIAISIINRFCDAKRVAFHRKTKIGSGENDYKKLRTWHLEPQGKAQFTGPIALLTNDSVFSGGEAFALAIRELPYVTIIGDRTNGIFSYTLDKKLPNGWRYCLSYQVYFSADMVCFEGEGIPVDIELLNKRADIEIGIDPLIVRALEELKGKERLRVATAAGD